MKHIVLISLTLMLWVPFIDTQAQSHVGAYTDLIIPVAPFSSGYGTGYGVGFMFRRFEMTRSFILDVSLGFQKISIKDNPPYFIEGKRSVTFSDHRNLIYVPLKIGVAWAFVPNASPLTQPFAGFDFGYLYAGTSSGGGAILLAPRLGWLIYPKERFLMGVELKYNTQMQLSERFNGEYTRIATIIDHHLTLQFSATVRIGR